MQLSRVTTQYDQAEDRFRLLGSVSEEGTLDLWITQRLFVRIVRVLLEWLELQAPELRDSDSDDPQVKSSLLNFAQQDASANIVRSPPVKAAPATQKVLVSELDIRKTEDHVILVFKVSPEEEAEIPFDVVQLRQWLSIVYGQWLKAEWPQAVWPDWIKDGAAVVSSGDSASMH